MTLTDATRTGQTIQGGQIKSTYIYVRLKGNGIETTMLKEQDCTIDQ